MKDMATAQWQSYASQFLNWQNYSSSDIGACKSCKTEVQLNALSEVRTIAWPEEQNRSIRGAPK